MKIELPVPSMVVLIGATGSGKSTFAKRHFAEYEILSSDFCRALASDDENDQGATNDAFEILHFIAGKRLGNYKTVVVDATNVQEGARKPLVALAKRHDLFPVAVVLNVPPRVCLERNASRADRQFGDHVVHNHYRDLRRALKTLRREGFRFVHVLSPEEMESVEFTRTPLYSVRPEERGPFDIIGDVHGCLSELLLLLESLGYAMEDGVPRHPDGRRLVFLGDLVDRGPDSPGVLRLAMRAVEAGAICVPGNHDVRLLRKLSGRDVKLTYGLAETMEQLAAEPPEFLGEVRRFLDSLTSHFVLDDGNLVVAHAGMKAEYAGRGSGRVREFALYGETTGETDEFGLPVRYDWASEYRGKARVVYGHTPVPEPQWLNNTIDIDTGCAFGGDLTALRYPELDLVSVPAARIYAEPVRPLRLAGSANLQQEHDDVLDLSDVTGRRTVETRLRGRITVAEENAIAALEVMSRYAADPRWLPYLPPTMSPTETSAREGLLEHPDEAFAYYRAEGATTVMCQEKHMGSRAVLAVCRSEEAAQARFGGSERRMGIVVTRTGRPFFPEGDLERAVLSRVRDAAEACGLFDELGSDWLLLDAELMPWSAKAQGLLREQYAAAGASGRASSAAALNLMRAAKARGLEGAGEIAERMARRDEDVRGFTDAYRRYCWAVEGIDDYRLAPFHLLASEGRVHTDKDHLWHMAMLTRLAETDSRLILATRHRRVELGDEAIVAEATRWWEEMTAAGGEGMVVKPLDFLHRGPKGLSQPAVKCRGPEYLRLIYGAEYLRPENLSRLRQRAVNRKRGLALREFALGLEALERFVAREPLRQVHECVFGVLALESELIDPRL